MIPNPKDIVGIVLVFPILFFIFCFLEPVAEGAGYNHFFKDTPLHVSQEKKNYQNLHHMKQECITF